MIKRKARRKTKFRKVLSPEAYSDLIQEVLERDGYSCRNPNCQSPRFIVAAHHIIFRSRGGDDDMENLISLCQRCHTNVHQASKLKLTIVGPASTAKFSEKKI